MAENISTIKIIHDDDKNTVTEITGSLQIVYLGLAQLYNYDKKLFKRIKAARKILGEPTLQQLKKIEE